MPSRAPRWMRVLREPRRCRSCRAAGEHITNLHSQIDQITTRNLELYEQLVAQGKRIKELKAERDQKISLLITALMVHGPVQRELRRTRAALAAEKERADRLDAMNARLSTEAADRSRYDGFGAGRPEEPTVSESGEAA